MSELDENMENEQLANQAHGHVQTDEFGWRTWKSQQIRTMRGPEDFLSFDEIVGGTEGRWEDPDPPGGNEHAPVIDWKWPEEIWSDVALFKSGVNGDNASDIKQGAAGDCWFLAALSVVAMYPDTLRSIIVQHDWEKGIFCCRFYADDESERLVCVDARIPTNAGIAYGRRPCYVRSADAGELWPIIIEKAFAKVYGSFEKIEGGFTSAGFASILGRVERNYIQKIQADKNLADPEQLWDFVSNNLWENGFILGCSWVQVSTEEVEGRLGETRARQGLIGGHAYGVMGVWEIGTTRLLKFRNPWGNENEWRGAWCDGGDEWRDHPEVAEAVGYTPRPDGTFHMSLADFANNLRMLGAARAFDARPDVAWVPHDVPEEEEEEPGDLSEVLCEDGSLQFETSGPKKWRTWDEGEGARSGAVGEDQTTKLWTRVSGPGSLSFDWKTSCEQGHDGVLFVLDGRRLAVLTGEVDWEPRTFNIGPGRHELAWIYVKDRSGSDAADLAALANVRYAREGAAPGSQVQQNEPVFITSHRNQQLEDRDGALGLHDDLGGWQQWTFRPCGDGRFFITSHRGQQLEDRDGRVGLHPDTGDWQKWYLSDTGDGRFFLTSHRSQKLQDCNGGLALADNCGEWERWTIPIGVGSGGGGEGLGTQVQQNEPVFITSHRNQQLEDRDGALGLHDDLGGWQQWTFRPCGDGRFFITSHRGQQLEDRDGSLGLHPDTGDWQKWYVSDAGDGRFFLTSHRSQKLQDCNGGLALADNCGEWERWTIHI